MESAEREYRRGIPALSRCCLGLADTNDHHRAKSRLLCGSLHIAPRFVSDKGIRRALESGALIKTGFPCSFSIRPAGCWRSSSPTITVCLALRELSGNAAFMFLGNSQHTGAVKRALPLGKATGGCRPRGRLATIDRNRRPLPLTKSPPPAAELRSTPWQPVQGS